MNHVFESLLEYVNTLDIIDAHEHFIGEVDHVQRYLSFYDFITSYIQWDLYSAGMAREFVWKYPQNEAEARVTFDAIEPYWMYVRHGSYARPIRLALREFYGVDDLARDSFLEVGRLMNQRNILGHYDEVFDKARIKRIINQSPNHPFDDPRFIYGRPIEYYSEADLKVFFENYPDARVDELVEKLDNDLATAVAKGAKSAKVFSVFLMQPPDKELAQADIEQLKQGQPTNLIALHAYLYDQTLTLCAKYGLVAAIHTGVWTDLNKQSPELIFPVVERHPETVFDVYHMGMPYVRQCAFLGKSYPNVNLNLCWSHAVSESMALHALDEWLDLVPTNKIIGFGGDLMTLPEHVWGQLQVAKENLARVMAHRIERQRLDMDGAKEILSLWLHDNPIRIYNLHE